MFMAGATVAGAIGAGLYLANNKDACKKAGKTIDKAMNSMDAIISKKMN